MSSAPLLMDVTIDGKPRKVVAVPSKQSWLYVFDRITGQPIWPIVETKVPQSDVPGEKTSPTQPFPTKPPPYARTHLATNDLIDFTPELRAQALEVLKRYRWEESPYVPLIIGNVNGKLGTINIGNTAGGVNWPGSAFDPETGMVLYPGVELAGDGRIARASAARASPISRISRASSVSPSGWRWRQAPAPTRCAGRRSRRGGCGRGAAPGPAPAAVPAPAQRPLPPLRLRRRGARGWRTGRRRAAGRPRCWWRRRRRRRQRPGTVARQAAVRRRRGHRREQGRADVAGAAWRYAGQRAQPPGAQGPHHSRRPARTAASARWSPRRS